jgi:hypothetical protein
MVAVDVPGGVIVDLPKRLGIAGCRGANADAAPGHGVSPFS